MARAPERDGLIERRADPRDARATMLFLTPRAKELRPVAEEVVAELDAHVGAVLPTRVRGPLKAALRSIADLDG
jgi:DNA-binding MarR family transcriptional regulator